MHVTADQMHQWCRRLLGFEGETGRLDLNDYLQAIPRLDNLHDVPRGTPVLIRGDVDAKVGAEVGDGDVRLRSMLKTLQIGRENGWKQIVFGHIGRDPQGSLDRVAARLGQLLQCDVPLITDWFDEQQMVIPDSIAAQIQNAAEGSVLVLENTRRYDIERVLWTAKENGLPRFTDSLAKLANEFADKVASIYINEALSAGSMDASSTVVPAAMERVALGQYVSKEFDGPMRQCRQAQLVVFSGLKIDKIDDLEAMVGRGKVRVVFSAGSLAMALRKASAELDGQKFCLGVAENSDHRNKPYYIPEERIEQGKRMIAQGREKGIRFVLPVDFINQDGKAVDELKPSDQQLDVGPKTSRLFEQEVGQFIESFAKKDSSAVAFYNGVFGKFEDRQFEEGTRRFVAQLKRLKEAGVEVYVGGGEGGKALEKYGRPDWVTHVFTAGGTVLNALGSEPIPYLVALHMATNR